MKLIDTHCHLYVEEFKEDIDTVMERARAEGVKKFFLPAIDSSETASLLALENKFKGECFAMMGLHPCSVKESYKEELQLVKDWIDKRDFAAIGEIGLDFYWDVTFKKEQYEVFESQIQWALDKEWPIVIHTRNAMAETIEIVKPFAAKGLRGIFHCFGGTIMEAQQIIEIEFYLGIGGVITYKKSGLTEALENISLEHLVLETDAPYLTPVPFRGKRNESSYLKYVAQKLAEVKKVSVEEVAAITSANAEKIFGS